MGFHDFPVRSPVKVLMIFFGILVLGYISLNRLTVSLFPDLRAPRITIIVETSGLSPEEIERTITEDMERRLLTLRNVSDLTTISRADTALATVSFEWGTEMDFALLDVKKAVGDLVQDERVTDLTTLQYDPNALPVYTFALSGIDDMEALQSLAREILKPALERMDGVAIAKVLGGLEKEVSVRVEDNLMMHYGLTLGRVMSALRATFIERTGGWVVRGSERMMLRMIGPRDDLRAIGSTVVGYTGDSPVYLRDIASVEYRTKEPKSLVRSRGKPAVGISLYKEINANTVRVVGAVRKRLDELAEDMPKGVEFEMAYDQSIFLRRAMRQLAQAAGLGMILAMATLLLFLRSLRPTIIISLAIPVSVIATFNLMFFQDITFNLMSLGGLALGSGMLVDSAIVVLESIFVQRQLGQGRQEAAVEGARQVGAAIVASTLTTCVVFLPIVFVHGVAGLLFKDFAKTVMFSLLASLLVALLLVPMLCGRILRARKAKAPAHRPIYRSLLGWSLRHRFVVVAAAAALVALFPFFLTQIPQEFMPKTDEGQVVMRLRMPAGTRIDVTNQAVAQVEGRIEMLGEAVEGVYSRIGESETDMSIEGEESEGPHTAEIVVTLKPLGEGGLLASQVIERLKPGLAEIPDLDVLYVLQQGSLAEVLSSGGAPIVVEIQGEELDRLAACANLTRSALEDLPQIHNVSTNVQEGPPEVRLKLDEVLLASLGFTVEGVVETLRSRLSSDTLATFESPEGDLDVRLDSRQFREEGLAKLGAMRLRSPSGREIALGDLADFEFARGSQEIVRRRQKRVARVMAHIREGKLSGAVEAVRAKLDEIVLPSGYRVRLSGEEEQRVESFKMLRFAFILALILVYMVLASILESLIQPLTILLTVPLAMIGVVAAFLLTGETLNMLAYIGIVMLVGIVVNNAIVLLDYVNQLRARGAGTTKALLLAGQRRLRPILMTTLTTILALTPLALGIGEGARLQRPLAVSVIGGLVSATILTLFVIPVVYSLFDDAGKALRPILRLGDAEH
jgi:HAE1 family hydrophobic/amphiphilic exporter-1